MASPRSPFDFRSEMARRAAVAAAAFPVCAGPLAARAPSVCTIIANPAVLGRLVTNVCVASDDTDRMQAEWREVGMIDNPETSPGLRPWFDLAVKATGGGCTTVFETDLEDAPVMAAFQTAMVQTHGSNVPMVSTNLPETGGENDLRARIEVAR